MCTVCTLSASLYLEHDFKIIFLYIMIQITYFPQIKQLPHAWHYKDCSPQICIDEPIEKLRPEDNGSMHSTFLSLQMHIEKTTSYWLFPVWPSCDHNTGPVSLAAVSRVTCKHSKWKAIDTNAVAKIISHYVIY